MNHKIFCLRKGNIHAIPVIHYNMEMAAYVRLAFTQIKPDCVAVELAETMQLQLLHAASRLPDISVVITQNAKQQPIYYMVEPCDPAFEALRSALEAQISAYCIDLDIDDYPDIHEQLPDPYAIYRIGLKPYYESYKNIALTQHKTGLDQDRELYMAKRLKELSFSYDRILFVGGMAHIENILKFIDKNAFPEIKHCPREIVELCTLTEHSCRDVMAESGWFSKHYESGRADPENFPFPPDRQKLIYQLYKEASNNYVQNSKCLFPGYHLRNLMKFVRNYALVNDQLLPNLFQILTAAKGCVDHNYAYETWDLATQYPYRRNIDALLELNLSIKDVWKHSKMIRFHLKEQGRKSHLFHQRKERSQVRFKPPGPFTICSYPPEDLIIERFGEFLKKKGTQILTEEAARTVPFSGSLEDGIDTKETIRHWHERKIYVKIKGKPPGEVGSVVVIFDDDLPQTQELTFQERYPWHTTWLGEHSQESDMAFYATPMTTQVIGPGISRCEYGGFMMSYPPRRLFDVWTDPDYEGCQSKPEVLLLAAIDYAVKPLIVYIAPKPPRTLIKSFARRFGKKIIYIPIGQFSPMTLNKLRIFHVLDGHDKREIADEYIF